MLATNFGVVRLRRDVLGHSSVGVIATERRPEEGGDNTAYGVDGNFGFGLTTITTYFAKTHTAGRTGRDQSYQTRAEYNGDRYGLVAQHLTVEPNFNPAIGFLRRSDFRKHYGLARFSPRPTAVRHVRKLTYQASLDYVTDNSNRLQSRTAIAAFTSDFNNADQITASYGRSYERLDAPFAIDRRATIPAGGYTFETTTIAYTLGPTRRARGTFTGTAGSFYAGSHRGVAYTGRLGVTTTIAIEPTISRDWVALPWGAFDTDLVSARVVYNRSPQTSVATLIQYNSTSRMLASNIRFQWEYRPGSDLFVVYNEGRETGLPGQTPWLQNRTLVVKLTRLLRY
jgi:hypothetical protein